jgi:pyruvate dehydrogenase E1 component
MSDEEIWLLNRGGLDSIKVFAAYKQAMQPSGRPTVILAKTIKGFGMGAAGEGKMTAHQAKKLGDADLKIFRDRFAIPVSDEDIAKVPYYKPPEDSEEIRYLHERRKALGGYLPARYSEAPKLIIPPLEEFSQQLESTGDREISTTMVLVRILTKLVKDENIGKHIVPIVPDEARTFGMEGMFRQIAIYSSAGQLYTPQDSEQLMYYREDKKGQILEEGINEGGAFCSWIAAATSYSNHGVPMIPFYIYYSMFGFQRIGDFAWAAGDMQARGFLIGGTAGRTTLAGEGLQHQDGHSHLLASTIPNCVAYDPAYAYELAVIVQDGMRRMYVEQENIFYYITCMNENYIHPAMPEGAAEGIVRGMYRLREGATGKQACVQLFGSGTILREVEAAAVHLEEQYNIAAGIWSITSYSELRRDGIDCEHWNLRHPEQTPQQSYVAGCLQDVYGPFIAASDYMRSVPDQIRQWVPGAYHVLGTDGFGRSDSRRALRAHFEVNRNNIVLAALRALADEGAVERSLVSKAILDLELDADKPNPVRC